MSAKAKAQEELDAAEFFPTPAWATLRLLDHVALPPGRWIEPSAGDGAIIRAVRTQSKLVEIHAIELRRECEPHLKAAVGERGTVTIADFARTPAHDGFASLVLGNPPFSLATKFVERGLLWAPEVVYLLKLAVLESAKRRGFFERVGTPDMFVLPERPSFTGKGTDSCAYAWMRWRRDRAQEGRVSILYDKRQGGLALGGDRG